MHKRALFTRFDRKDCGMKFALPSKTDESCYDDVNIEKIYQRGMNNLKPNTSQPLYGIDMSTFPSYQESLQIVATAKNQFEKMPVALRERFNNSPEQFVEFCNNPEKNYDEGVKLGIFVKKPDISPQNEFTVPVSGSAAHVVTPQVECVKN